MTTGRLAPLRRAEALRILAEHREELAAMGIDSLALFGSVARDEAGAQSDIDLLVEFDPTISVGLFKFLDIQEYLEGILGRPVDLVMRDALKRQIRDQVLAEAIDAA
jgi:predicted nucleotidyltransferase